MNFTDGSKAKKIHHSSIIYDDKGTTWMIRSDSKTDSNYFNMTGPKSIKKGKYKMETVHTVDMPSGYWPKLVYRKEIVMKNITNQLVSLKFEPIFIIILIIIIILITTFLIIKKKSKK